jgi:hypothetical protein
VNKKFLSAFVLTALMGMTVAVSGSSAAPVSSEDEQFPSQITAVPGFHGIEMNEISGLRDNGSLLYGETASGSKLCTSTSDASCSGNYQFKAVLGPCDSTTTIDCIESVTATTSSGAAITGTFKEFFPARGVNDYTGSTADGVPSGRPPSLWTLSGLPHVAGSDYQVVVTVSGEKKNGDARKPLRTFFASITPVNIHQTTCDPQFNGVCMDDFVELPGPDGKTQVRFRGVAADQDLGVRCANWGENSKCALKRTFPEGAKFSLKVKLSTVPTGWLHGRLTDPTASITTADGATTVQIAAQPTKVPIVSTGAQWADLPTTVQEWFTANCATNCGTRDPGSLTKPPAERNAIANTVAYKESSFEQLKLWKSFIKDSASAIPTQWSVRTLSYDEMTKSPKCIAEGTGVTGIVATNATLYSEGPPSFDSATSTLNYKVAAPHFEKDGKTEFKGRYDLILRSDIAKCLYNLDDSPVTSEVAVVDEAGASKTATTSMTQADGWFKFSALGYTHSAPTVKTKLLQTKVAAPAVTVPATAPKVIAKPRVKRGKTITAASIAKTVKLRIPKGAKVVTKISAKSKKVCSLSRANTVKALKKGNCAVSIAVTPKKSKKVPKPKTTRKSVTVVVS